MAGTGCKPDTQYAVTESALHSSGRTLAAGQTTASGSFLAAVTVQGTGEPNGNIDVSCENSAGTTIEPYQVALTFYSSAGAQPTVRQGTTIPFTGGAVCQPGSTVQAVAGSHAEGYRVIGQSTAGASGTFSVVATIPALSAGVHDVFAACEWNGADEPNYPAYMHVNVAG
jgi:hypothetical protein